MSQPEPSEENPFLSLFGTTVRLRVLNHLLTNMRQIHYLSGIAKELEVSHSSVDRVIEPLKDLGIVDELKLGGRIRTFRLNQNHPKTKLLIKLYKNLLDLS